MEGEISRSCATCEYRLKVDNIDAWECRLYPPVGEHAFRYTIVREEDWCYQYIDDRMAFWRGG